MSPLSYPTYDDLAGLIRAEFRRQLPNVDPTVFGNWARGFADGNATLAQAITFLVRDLEKQLFPQTATNDFLDLWGDYEGLERKSASSAFGSITLGGTPGTVIPFATEFKSAAGLIYESTSSATISTTSQLIATLTRSGFTVTATLASEHQLATGFEPTISGANEPEYNGTYPIVVTGRDSFTYQITSIPSTPATGTISYSIDIASVPIEAQETGQTTNLDSGASLSLVNGISGADTTGIAQFDGISGGSELETDDEYRARIFLSRSILSGVFTPDQVKLAALSIAGNTRAFVKTPTASVCPGTSVSPVPGQVGVFILRDNDASIIPSQTIIDATKQAIIDDGSLPAHSSEIDVLVDAPTLVATDFDFTALSPDTPTMRNAVVNQLAAFFEDSVDFEESVTAASYLGAIQSTQDLQTGAFLQSFSLSTPSGGIPVSDGEIAVLGDVTFTI